jgi:hypothetical protein
MKLLGKAIGAAIPPVISSTTRPRCGSSRSGFLSFPSRPSRCGGTLSAGGVVSPPPRRFRSSAIRETGSRFWALGAKPSLWSGLSVSRYGFLRITPNGSDICPERAASRSYGSRTAHKNRTSGGNPLSSPELAHPTLLGRTKGGARPPHLGY